MYTSDNIVPRDDLCRALYSLLCDKLPARVVQVRGAAASGKSTFLSLFQRYILKQDQHAHVYHMVGWPSDSYKTALAPLHNLVDLNAVWQPTYILLDDAQVTFQNAPLWYLLKDGLNLRYQLVRFVLFCGYGSRNLAEINDVAVMGFSDYEIITHWKTIPKFSDETHGLLFTRAEYEDLVKRAGVLLDNDLLDEFFRLSAGHVGAILFLIEQVKTKNKPNMQTPCSLSAFREKCPNYLLAHDFAGFNIDRGLPDIRQLNTDGEVVAVLRTMLRNGRTQGYADREALDRAHKAGWLYFDTDTSKFVMVSPLHAAALSWMLEPPTDALVHDKIEDLVFDVLSRFKPSQIHLPYRVAGPPSEDAEALEYAYQAEFYRALHDLTHGGVRLTAEFASGQDATLPGRLDFVVPSKRWAIDITREGSGIDTHWERLKSGAYSDMKDDGIFTDYVLVDCCVSRPVHAHLDISFLYHAVFHFESNTVTILNNHLDEVKTYKLPDTPYKDQPTKNYYSRFGVI